MSTEILTFSPAFGLTEDIQFNTQIFQGTSGKEKRYSTWEYGLRSLDCSLHEENESAVDVIWDFFKARKGGYDTFWVKFPTKKNKVVTDEAVGVGDGLEDEFLLDKFPIDTSSLVLKHNGIIQTSGFSVSNNLTTEQSIITYATAPGSSIVITASYEFYIQVRFVEDTFSREKIAFALYNASIKLIEVHWITYREA